MTSHESVSFCFLGHRDQVEAKIVNELDRLVSVDKKGDKEYKKLFKQM